MPNSKYKVNFVDLSGEYKTIKKDVNDAISRVLQSGHFVLGDEVKSFEEKLAEFTNRKYAVGLASGTDALTIAIKSLDLTNKDEVLLPANVYPSAFGVALSGVKVRLCDVDPGYLNITLGNIKKTITQKTKAIVVVHLYGNPVDIDPIKKFTKKRGIYLIEDCAQAAGSFYKSKNLGTFGDLACFSFYPTKNLGAYGDGGAIVTNNKKVYRNALLWRVYGEEERYKSVLVGFNSRLDEIQAAILSAKLGYVNQWNSLRHRVAERYNRLLKGLPLEIVKENNDGISNYHLFVVRTKNRDGLANYLKKRGISTAVHYPVPIHLTRSFKFLGYEKGDFPVSERASAEVLSLPMYPAMPIKHVDIISSCIRKFFIQGKGK